MQIRILFMSAATMLAVALSGCGSTSGLSGERPNERVYPISFNDAQLAVIDAMQIAKFHIIETKEVEEDKEIVYSGYYMRTGQQRGQMADFQVYVRDLGDLGSRVRLQLPSPTQYAATSPQIVQRRFFDALERQPLIASGRDN